MVLERLPTGFRGFTACDRATRSGQSLRFRRRRIGRTYRNKPKPGAIHILVPPEGDLIERRVWEQRLDRLALVPAPGVWNFRCSFQADESE